MKKAIIISVGTELDGYQWEKLEEAIADCARSFGVKGEVESRVTGNSMIL
jgi:hypothetical protein